MLLLFGGDDGAGVVVVGGDGGGDGVRDSVGSIDVAVCFVMHSHASDRAIMILTK